MDGYMLGNLTCGMSPVISIMEGVQQVFYIHLKLFYILFLLSSITEYFLLNHDGAFLRLIRLQIFIFGLEEASWSRRQAYD